MFQVVRLSSWRPGIQSLFLLWAPGKRLGSCLVTGLKFAQLPDRYYKFGQTAPASHRDWHQTGASTFWHFTPTSQEIARVVFANPCCHQTAAAYNLKDKMALAGFWSIYLTGIVIGDGIWPLLCGSFGPSGSSCFKQIWLAIPCPALLSLNTVGYSTCWRNFSARQALASTSWTSRNAYLPLPKIIKRAVVAACCSKTLDQS